MHTGVFYITNAGCSLYFIFTSVCIAHTPKWSHTDWVSVCLTVCVRAVAALQCEVCTQRTAACDCQSYDSCRISWSSSAVTLPFPPRASSALSRRSCAAMLPPPPKPNLILIIFDLKVSYWVTGYRYLPLSGLWALLVSRVDPKLVEQKKKKKSCDNHHVVTNKQKKRHQKLDSFADCATPESPFECIYLCIWQESWVGRWNLQMTNGNKSKAAGGEAGERVTQQSCEEQRMLLRRDLSADSIIIIWDKCPRTNGPGSDNGTRHYY